jgi:hypothetical protein
MRYCWVEGPVDAASRKRRILGKMGVGNVNRYLA